MTRLSKTRPSFTATAPIEPGYYLQEHTNESLSKHKPVEFIFLHFLSFSFKCVVSNKATAQEAEQMPHHTLNTTMATWPKGFQSAFNLR